MLLVKEFVDEELAQICFSGSVVLQWGMVNSTLVEKDYPSRYLNLVVKNVKLKKEGNKELDPMSILIIGWDSLRVFKSGKNQDNDQHLEEVSQKFYKPLNVLEEIQVEDHITTLVGINNELGVLFSYLFKGCKSFASIRQSWDKLKNVE